MINSGSLSHEKALPTPTETAVSFSRTGFSATSMQVLIHILMWLLLISLIMTFHLFSRPFGANRLPLPFVYKTGFLFLLNVGLFYFNANYAIPRLLFKKKLFWFVSTLIIAVIIVQAANYWFSSFMQLEARMVREFRLHAIQGAVLPAAPPFPLKIPLRNPEPRIIDLFAWLNTFIILGVSTSLTVTMKWFRDAENQKNLEKERLFSELSHLKNQINPHFFFNTLNNIYALTETNPKDAQEAIYTLSKMMRYMLYETENHQVLLSKEIDFIKHYIELMRLRLTDTVTVEFDYPSDVGSLTVAPLIFVTFIENAFKHGVSYNEKSYVRTQLKIEDKAIHFTVRNRLLKQSKIRKLEGSGIGLVNVKRRLQLLYPEEHQLRIESDQNEYIVHVTLYLS
ncbi:sensor histidine kinase [Rhodocytophaga rosea]|uniref:Sensor histidine kinase n=1 Tax=Rhodocytophaga rosea TaxID=2704465 RepID=A0A6C0GJ59_9BACT|nr:sensor histidine kinase [Rhodocytophaga rosea]QHT67834.1 sensor histidine kinase [Rhodocytophaga rosea]